MSGIFALSPLRLNVALRPLRQQMFRASWHHPANAPKPDRGSKMVNELVASVRRTGRVEDTRQRREETRERWMVCALFIVLRTVI